MPTVTVVAKVTAKSDAIEAVKTELLKMIAPTRKENGCIEYLFGVVKVFHRPHPSPDTDKGAVSSIRKWLEENGVIP